MSVKGFPIFTSKGFMIVSNLLLMICGILLVTVGFVIFFDPKKILLFCLLTSMPTTMPEPILFYVGIGLVGTGVFLLATSVLGYWIPCFEKKSYYTLIVYMLLVIIILIGECGIYGTFLIGPKCHGMEVDSKHLTRKLQENYGNVNEKQEQFTAAIDLAQSLFGCCGIESANEYDTSLWRLQTKRPSLAVPLSCCKLENTNATDAYLNPKPVNSTLCQALETTRHTGYRHVDGCHAFLQHMFAQHLLIFFALGLGVAVSGFLVVLSTILMCLNIQKHRYRDDKRSVITADEDNIKFTT